MNILGVLSTISDLVLVALTIITVLIVFANSELNRTLKITFISLDVMLLFFML